MPVTSEKLNFAGDDALPAIFYLGSANQSVPWDRLNELKKGYPPLSQQERCEIFLKGINGDRLKVREWNRLVGVPVHEAMNESTEMELFEHAIPPLRASLDRIVEHPRTAITEIGGNLANIIDGEYFVFPEVEFDGKSFIERERVMATSLGVALAYALTLFLKPDLKFGELLRKCGWRECSRFELGEPPKTSGQPPTFYCNDAHRQKDVLRQTRERVAAKRAGMTVEKWRAKQARMQK
jgi:hypothetical protein